MFGRAITILAVALAVSGIEATCPGAVYENTVSPADQQNIVDLHNNFRLQLAQGKVSGQPKAADMKKMRWDPALAQAAQAIANTCVFAHVKVNDTRFPVGQNLYTGWSSAPSSGARWSAATTSWWNEHTTYAFGTTTYNHYTQMAWANSYLVGCGYTYYQNANRAYQKLYVCNYGPAGNFLRQTPYKVGPGCENLC